MYYYYDTKFEDVQIDLLKAVRKKGEPLTRVDNYLLCRCDEAPDAIGVSDGHWIVWIPNQLFYLDIDKIFDFSNREPVNCNRVVPTRNEVFGGEMLNKSVTIPNGNKKPITLDEIQISNADNSIAYINSSLFKYFDLSRGNLSFCGVDEKHPVNIYCDDVLVGTVLPTNHHE